MMQLHTRKVVKETMAVTVNSHFGGVLGSGIPDSVMPGGGFLAAVCSAVVCSAVCYNTGRIKRQQQHIRCSEAS